MWFFPLFIIMFPFMLIPAYGDLKVVIAAYPLFISLFVIGFIIFSPETLTKKQVLNLLWPMPIAAIAISIVSFMALTNE